MLITGVPNGRVWADDAAWRAARTMPGADTVDDLRRRLAAESDPGVAPERWWRSVDPDRHDVRIRWTSGEPAHYDVLISPRTDPPAPWHWHDPGPPTGAPVTNNPQLSRWLRSLVSNLRGFLANRLPAAMVPAAFVAVDDLPTTTNGKVDRDHLPEPDEAAADATAAFVEPRSPLEDTLTGIWSRALGIERVSVEADFFDLGGHSLMVAQLVTEVQRACQVHLPLREFLEHSSVAEAAHLIQHLRGQAPAASTGSLTVLDLKAASRLDPAIRPGPQETGAASGRVLLTGATGFLGGFLLDELMTQTRVHVDALVRDAGSAAAAMDRLRANLTRMGVWDDDWRSRITPVAGDLSRPALGMTPRQFDGLAERIDAVYHNGAQVNMMLPFHSLRAANVEGTVELLRLAVRHGGKPVHYVSSLIALYLMRPDHPQTEVPLTFADLDEHLLTTAANGYGISKFVAEQLLRGAADRGVPVTVYRPGSVSGHSRTGAANTGDFLHAMLRQSLESGYLPQDIRLDPVPVDFVARALVRLSLTSEATGAYFHLTNPQPMPVEDFLQWGERRGYPMELVDRKFWLRVATEQAQQPGHPLNGFSVLLQTLLDFHGTHRFMQAGIRQADMRSTRLTLDGTGIACPPVSPDLLDTYLEHFLRTGFMRRTPQPAAR